MYKAIRRLAAGLAVLGLILTGAGCVTAGSGGEARFEPDPSPDVDQRPLAAVSTRPVTELLREAQRSFEAANDAHEAGDSAGALKHYSDMLALLAEADLDPEIYYSVREHFSSILNLTTQHAEVLAMRERHTPSDGYAPVHVPFPLPERVLEEIDRIQNGYPKNFQAGLDRSHQYLPYIRAELEEAGLPRDLEMVAMIESLFQPTVRSRAGAVGMWQFMSSTGKRFGMRVDHEVDERRNWQRQTHAAIDYLKYLYEFFDEDWSLAVSAYNMGEGGLSRAMEANGGERDLWKLLETPPASNRIQLETKRYFAKYLATLIVARNPQRYGFTVNPRPALEYDRVQVSGPYLLADLDEAMGYESGTLEECNPDLLERMTPMTGSFALAVPAGDGSKLASALGAVKKMNQGGSHRVARGETMSGIASRYRVATRDLMRLNNITSPRRLRVGQTLRIPGNARGGAVSDDGPSLASTVRTSRDVTYTVKRGDTLYDIARHEGVSVSELQAWNDLGRKTLKVGQKLQLRPDEVPPRAVARAEASPSPAAEPVPSQRGSDAGTWHTVRAGESPWKIAQAYSVDLDDLLKQNNLTGKSRIVVGQKLLVRAGEAAPAAPEKVQHTVVRGDTASTIAQKYGVKTSEFLAWNGLNSKSILPLGKTYVVYPKGTAAAAAKEAAPIEHTVSRGQNPTTIARRYGVSVNDLFEWNDWSRNHVLQVGDKVVVRRR